MIFNFIVISVILAAILALHVAYQAHPEIKLKRFHKICVFALLSVMFFLIALYLSLYVIK